ncbi:tRNA (guanosine(37)-N1)-methyltransferase TrmD [[Mycoplasma] testudinis]|uniref:tRNA (guanosine(37)-N1)-methyltransferase TrmD n=1 Tax=[Mycoplasma] testudinis TaxID=33924 RepID=UPI00048504BF|nr:tRNA (guanosine(37)-N1)-methyltransferase TrmD [[Mycoplasma] testudinis]
MRISVLSLFPNLFDEFLKTSIVRLAQQKQIVKIEVINFRDYATDKHQKVDDTAFGGGAGMVLMLDPIVKCLQAIKTDSSKVYLLSPDGVLFEQSKAQNIAKTVDHLILIAGHYEGFDARIENYVDGKISIGDYVLTGGELPAMVVIESVVRLINDVINPASLQHESFNNNLLDHPSYTKPAIYNEFKVPEVLLSGNHQAIEKFNLNEQIRITKQNRPDLYVKYLKHTKGKTNGKSKNK